MSLVENAVYTTIRLHTLVNVLLMQYMLPANQNIMLKIMMSVINVCSTVSVLKESTTQPEEGHDHHTVDKLAEKTKKKR